MTLTASDRANILQIIERVHEGSAGKYVDDTSAEVLARIFGDSCGFKCGCPGTLQEALRDEPVVALLQLLLCAAA